jgi:acyl-coenzyme A thioesterase PaaI-like protein
VESRADELDDAADRLDELSALLESLPQRATDMAGTRPFARPMRGSQGAFSVPIEVLEHGPGYRRGRVWFRQFHHGANGAAHGGAIALLFDELLGTLSNSDGRPAARTAYLTTNFRRIARIGVELRYEATIDRVEGRKVFSSGRLTDGEHLVADAEALFVQLRPDQP